VKVAFKFYYLCTLEHSSLLIMCKVRRSSVRVQRSSESVRRSSAEGCGVDKLGCSVAELGCGRAQLGVRRSSVGSAWACCKTGPSLNLGSAPQGSFSYGSYCDENMERDFGEWRRVIVMYE